MVLEFNTCSYLFPVLLMCFVGFLLHTSFLARLSAFSSYFSFRMSCLSWKHFDFLYSGVSSLESLNFAKASLHGLIFGIDSHPVLASIMTTANREGLCLGCLIQLFYPESPLLLVHFSFLSKPCSTKTKVKTLATRAIAWFTL